MRSAAVTLAVLSLAACRSPQPQPPAADAPIAHTAPEPPRMEEFLASFLDEVAAAESGEELVAIGQAARDVEGIGEIKMEAETAYPLTIAFDPPLDAEALALGLGWTLDGVTIDATDQHRSIPELMVYEGDEPVRSRAGAWTLKIAIDEMAPGPGPSRLAGKPVSGSGAAIRFIRVQR